MCPAGGGACLASGSLGEGLTSAYAEVPLPAAGAYVLSVTSETGANFGDFKADNLVCRSYNNRVCTARCRSCTQTLSATCYYSDPAGLAAATAASPTGGAGSNAGTIIGEAQTAGAPFTSSGFGASLPLSAGQKLNPRCQLNSVSFQTIMTSKGRLPISLPTDGSDEVVLYAEQCAALTAEQIALVSSRSTGFADSTTLALQGPAVCKDVISFRAGSSVAEVYDEQVTSYALGGDVKARDLLPGSSSSTASTTELVCSSQGQLTNRLAVMLPEGAWRTSTFTVATTHTSTSNLCDDESCIGGNADGACSACSYTYRVRFACDTPAPTAPTTPPPSTGGGGGGIIGDPQFVGLRGQQYQVHGVAGEVYNIVSSAALQYNARFVFLDSGACPVVDGKLQRKGCYSHPGSYLGELGLKTAGERELIRLEAGGAQQGFAAVTLNERELAVGETALLEDGAGFIARNSSHVVSVSVGAWAFVFDNSDMFVNQRVAVSGDASALRSHGLLGQTWREQSYPRSPIKFIQGKVDDYVIREGDVFGDSFAFNAFN